MAGSRGALYQGTRLSRVRITTGGCRVGKRRACQERALATGFHQESSARPHMEPRPRRLHHSRHQGLPTLQKFRQHPPSCAPGPHHEKAPIRALSGRLPLATKRIWRLPYCRPLPQYILTTCVGGSSSRPQVAAKPCRMRSRRSFTSSRLRKCL